MKKQCLSQQKKELSDHQLALVMAGMNKTELAMKLAKRSDINESSDSGVPSSCVGCPHQEECFGG